MWFRAWLESDMCRIDPKLKAPNPESTKYLDPHLHLLQSECSHCWTNKHPQLLLTQKPLRADQLPVLAQISPSPEEEQVMDTPCFHFDPEKAMFWAHRWVLRGGSELGQTSSHFLCVAIKLSKSGFWRGLAKICKADRD